MRSLIWLPALLLLHSPYPSIAKLGPGSIRAPAYHPTTSDLSWLEGTWRGRVGARDFETRYTGPEGGVVLSASKYIAKSKVTGFEFERFEEKDGHVVLTPYPDGKESPATFRLTDFDQKTRRAVFENPEHDFPTKISYQRVAGDRLTMLVSGPGKDGKEKVIRYELKAGTLGG
jgi:hypothetical protein